jgi:hypothetical protein
VTAVDPVGRYLENCAGTRPCDRPTLYGIAGSLGVAGVDIKLDPRYTITNPTPTPTPSTDGSIRGLVTRDSNPVAGVEVCAVSTTRSLTACATTSADGTYVIDGLPTSNYRVEFDGGAICYRQRIDCSSVTLVGVASPFGRTRIDAQL